jgi:hypothetical protein
MTKQYLEHRAVNYQKRNALFFVIMAILASLNLSSCATNFAHHMALRNVDGIDTVYSTLGPPAPSDGRLIIYWEKSSLIAASGQFKIRGDAGYLTAGYITRTGAIMDLPAGQYSLSVGGMLNKKEVNLTIEAGKTFCYNTETLFVPLIGAGTGGLKSIPIQECILDLSQKDIRCCLNNCLVLTVIPEKGPIFRPYAPNANHREVELKSKDFNIGTAKSRIYITRDMYTLGMVKAGLDAEPSFTMEGDIYLCYEVEPGHHIITVSDPNGQRGFKIEARAGQIYYFHTDTLDYLDDARGRELVEDYDLMKNGFLVEQTGS